MTKSAFFCPAFNPFQANYLIRIQTCMLFCGKNRIMIQSLEETLPWCWLKKIDYRLLGDTSKQTGNQSTCDYAAMITTKVSNDFFKIAENVCSAFDFK